MDTSRSRRIGYSGPVPDAMKPDFHGVKTHWNQGFMASRQRLG